MKREAVAAGLLFLLLLGTALHLRCTDRLIAAVERDLDRTEQAAQAGDYETALDTLEIAHSLWDAHRSYAQAFFRHPDLDALQTMLEAAKEDKITKWQISAGYRTWDDQVKLLNAKISSYRKKNKDWSSSKARRAALKSVAEPGCSEHHLGLAFDINVKGAKTFSSTKQYKWLKENCWDYGFIMRYTKEKEKITGFTAEAWHIRYVGVNHAKYMQEHDLCLEEYIEGIEEGKIRIPSETEKTEEDPDGRTGSGR